MDIQTLVIDNGSDSMKLGFAGDDTPRCVFPTVTGKLRPRAIRIGITQLDTFLGDEALSLREFLNLQYPLQKGLVTDWDKMEKIWHYSFYYALRVAPEEHPVLLTEAPLTSETHREKMAQLMFESFNVPALHFAMQAVLALLETGTTTGVVVDSGGDVTHTVPVHQGHAVTDGIMQMDLAGCDITQRLEKLLGERGYSFKTATERGLVRDVKEKMCFVALDYDSEMQKEMGFGGIERNYELPDGNIISVGSERFRCPEALFQPSFAGKDCIGIHECTFHSIAKCDHDIRKELYSNIVLAGGSTMFDGFPQRMSKELTALAPDSAKINVVAPESRKYAVWRGGSMLGSQSTFLDMVVSQEEYFEAGPRILHSKCSEVNMK